MNPPSTSALDLRRDDLFEKHELLSKSQESVSEPLCVDLDETLVRTDTLLEAYVSLLRRAPLRAIVILLSLFAGKAAFKSRLSEESHLNVAHLPYNIPLLEFIRFERAKGRMIVLATGAHETIAHAVADHLGLFDQVVCTRGGTNNVGRKKAETLETKFKETGFWYVGSANADVPAWKASTGAIVVSNSRRWTRKLGRLGIPIVREFPSTTANWKTYLKAIRVHQWLKNLLIFVPVFTAHRLTDLSALGNTILAAAAVSLVASSLYVFNDLIDLEDDRNNPLKKSRPLASGAISLKSGLAIALGCAAVGWTLSAFLPPLGRLVLLAYAVGSFSYSAKLKRYLMMDVVGLALLYTVRILMGAYSSNIPISSWLLGFSMFLFLCLALVKRTSELASANQENTHRVPGRAYKKGDFDQVASLGSASAYLSVLVFAFYLRSPEVMQLYAHPDRMWFVCVLLIYWLSRLLVLAHRGDVEGDPVLFMMKDRLSYVVGSAVLLIISMSV